MTILILGATGRTGRLVAGELLAAGEQLVVLVRDPIRLELPRDDVIVVVGSSTDRESVMAALAQTVGRAMSSGSSPTACRVVSALGPTAGATDLHQRTAAVLIPAMRSAGVTRFIGISGASVCLPGDQPSRADRMISAAVRRMGAQYATDKAAEAAAYLGSELHWTLVRPGRLTDGPASGRVKSSPNCPVGWRISRADLARFVAAEVGHPRHLQQAPFVAS